MKKFILILSMLSLSFNLLQSKDLEVSREFTLFTSQQAQGYFKPLFTTIGQSLNTNLFTNADYQPRWSISFDIAGMGMFVPKSQKEYKAVLPDLFGQTMHVRTAQKIDGQLYQEVSGSISQPTIYGGRSYAVFAAPQNHFPPDSFYKSVAFVEGNNINFMSGLPVLQFAIGLPTYSQLRLRYLMVPLQGASLNYYTIALNQNIDKLFDMFSDTTISLAAHIAYHSINRSNGLDISSIALGTHFTKRFTPKFAATFALQYENLNGNFKAIRDVSDNNDVVNNPYSEIRNAENLEFNIESFTNFRIGGGLAYRIGFLELNTSAYYASQPIVSAGLTFHIYEQKLKVPEPEPIPEPEPEPVPIIVPEVIAFDEPELPEVVPIFVEQQRAILNADVQAFSIENGIEKPIHTIYLEEKISRHISPLLPMVFFDDASSEIPQRYSLISKDSAMTFVQNDVSEGNALDVYYDILNIIGSRMNRFKDANITLVGTNSGQGTERNNTRLSQARAETIKNYLVNTWNIEPNRIKIQASNLPQKASNQRVADGIEENRRVEISSDTWEIIAPSVIQDTSRYVLPSFIRFKQTVQADAGLKNWRLYVASNTQQVMEKHGGSNFIETHDLHIQDNNTIKRILRNNLQFNLTVNDDEGHTFISEVHSIPIELKTIDRETAARGDTIRNLYDLILFDFDKSTLSADNQRIINMIKKELPDNAIVKVIGFTDRMGDEAYNQRLSLSRANAAANALGRTNAETIGSGKSVLLYNNDLPEGRFYSRTVIVEVKIPIN